MEVDARACPNCLGTDFHDASCVRCRRPIQLPSEYADELERLAWAVVDCAYELYGDLRGTAATGSDLQRRIVDLANALRHFHYDGDGCLDGEDEE